MNHSFTDSFGSTISFGDNAGQPVTWRVIAVDSSANNVLVISEKSLISMMHQADGDYSWSNSKIRTWLNNEGTDGFISQYGLNGIERAIIPTTHEGGNSSETTTDKVFLLSISEASNYFVTGDRPAYCAYKTSGTTTAIGWWLRSCYPDDPASSATVMYSGEIPGSLPSGTEAPVRPAFWINYTEIAANELKKTYDDYAVGETGPAGGYIFYDAGSVQTSQYVDSSGNTVDYKWRFLEAAPVDASTSAIFGYYRTSSTGSNLTVQSDLDTAKDKDSKSTYDGNAAVGQGRMNTSQLVNAMGTTAYTSTDTSTITTTDTYAAKICDDYTRNGYSDWFLPSIGELMYMDENLCEKDVGTWSDIYWSSSERTVSHSWYYDFHDQFGGWSARAKPYSVRAVRAF